jgi:hypothetical protein
MKTWNFHPTFPLILHVPRHDLETGQHKKSNADVYEGESNSFKFILYTIRYVFIPFFSRIS